MTDLRLSPPDPYPECPACDTPLRDDYTCACGYAPPEPDYDLIAEQQAEYDLAVWEAQHERN